MPAAVAIGRPVCAELRLPIDECTWQSARSSCRSDLGVRLACLLPSATRGEIDDACELLKAIGSEHYRELGHDTPARPAHRAGPRADRCTRAGLQLTNVFLGPGRADLRCALREKVGRRRNV